MQKWTFSPELPKDYDRAWSRFSYVSVVLVLSEDGIYHLTLETNSSIWKEKYSRAEDADDFLRGVRAGMVLTAGNHQAFPDSIAYIKSYGKQEAPDGVPPVE